jgi:hypothetical protein
MQYVSLEYNNNNITNFGMVLRSNGMLLSHFKRNPDTNPPHPTPPQALCKPEADVSHSVSVPPSFSGPS